MKKSLAVTLVALFVLAVSFAMVPKKANAIPAFAQKYHFSCAVCHTVFPNLNPFGRAFWRNGFRLPGTNGTPADATQIADGLSLPNPWPIPIVLEAQVYYQHVTNENVLPVKGSHKTDAFNVKDNLVIGGATKLYTPFANSLSFYANYGETNGNGLSGSVWASLNGLGSGFGLAPHLFNLKMGMVATASPYFYRQQPFSGGFVEGPTINGQGLTVGADGEGGALIHAPNPGIALYGTPGYHLWYKVTMTNDAGPAANTPASQYTAASKCFNDLNGNKVCTSPASTSAQASNAMEYSYQLKEYLPTSAGQLEFGYYGASIAEPIINHNTTARSFTDGIQVNGVDLDLANDVYELGVTYMEQHDSNPYNGLAYAGHHTNGYSDFEAYGRYLFPTLLGHGAMLVADFSTYSWQHKQTEELYNQAVGNTSPTCANGDLYENGTYTSSNNCMNEGIQDAFDIFGDLNLAYNAHLYAGYIFTNKSQDDMFRTGLYFAF